MGASKLGGKVADVGWKFTEVASQKVNEVSGTMTEKVGEIHCFLFAAWLVFFLFFFSSIPRLIYCMVIF